MSLAQTLSTYITLNLMVAIGFISLRLWWMIARWREKSPSSSSELRLHYSMITMIALLTVIHPFFPRSEIFHPTIKQWSAQSIRSFPDQYTAPDQGGYFMVPTLSGTYSVNADKVALILALISLVVTGIGLFRIAKDIRSLAVIRRRSYSVRKLGSVTIFLNDEKCLPG